jgi:hypothetical protein
MGRLSLTIEKGEETPPEPDTDEVQAELDIDLYNLHLEAKKQAGLVRKYSNIMVEKKRRYEQKKMELKILEFEIAKDIKKNPLNYGLTDAKITDTMLKMAIPSNKSWQKQYKQVIEAESFYEDWKNVVDACKTKSFDLRVAAELWLNQYYGDVNLKRKESK